MADDMLEARTERRTYRRVEVIAGHRRRQNWPAQEKARIVMESLDPEANISEVARRNGVSRGLLTLWRRQARELGMAPAPSAMFAAVRIESDADQSNGAVETAVPTDKSVVAAASERLFRKRRSTRVQSGRTATARTTAQAIAEKNGWRMTKERAAMATRRTTKKATG